MHAAPPTIDDEPGLAVSAAATVAILKATCTVGGGEMRSPPAVLHIRLEEDQLRAQAPHQARVVPALRAVRDLRAPSGVEHDELLDPRRRCLSVELAARRRGASDHQPRATQSPASRSRTGSTCRPARRPRARHRPRRAYPVGDQALVVLVPIFERTALPRIDDTFRDRLTSPSSSPGPSAPARRARAGQRSSCTWPSRGLDVAQT